MYRHVSLVGLEDLVPTVVVTRKKNADKEGT